MKITHIIFNLLFIASGHLGSAQAPPCLWAQSVGGPGSEAGTSVVTDVNGNVFVAGYFQSPIIVFGTTTLSNSGVGSTDVFIVKYSPSGSVLWANSAGGSGNDEISGVSTDANGNVFVTGYFQSSTIVFGTTTLTFAGGWADIFTVKFSPSGTVLWANSAGGTNGDVAYSISTDASGNVFVTGGFNSATIAFGATTLTNSNIGGSDDVFIVKYSSSGALLWASSAGGINNEVGYGMSTDASGNVFVTGSFSSPNIAFGTITLTAVNSDIFIVKYSPAGAVLWASSAGTIGLDWGSSVSTDASGNVIVTGRFMGPTLAFGTTTLVTVGGNDLFVVKYSPIGMVLWANSAGGNNWDEGLGVSTDASGNVIVTGSFTSPTIAFGATTLTNAFAGGGVEDAFIAKYSPSGVLLWASSGGGVNADIAYGVFPDINGNLFATGFFRGPTIAFGTTTLTNTGGADIFIAKFGIGVVGINENQLEETGISIYPNPFNSQTTITFTEEQTKTSIRIVDILGKEIKSISNFQGYELVIEKNSMQSGIYFVQVIDDKIRVENRMLVVQ